MHLGTWRGVTVSFEPQRRIYAFEGNRFGTGGFTEDELRGVREYLRGVDGDHAEDALAVVEPALEAGRAQ